MFIAKALVMGAHGFIVSPQDDMACSIVPRPRISKTWPTCARMLSYESYFEWLAVLPSMWLGIDGAQKSIGRARSC